MVDIFISPVASISRRSGGELIIITAKIRVSYTDPEDLQEVVKRLQPVKKIKVSKNEYGGYKKAYIDLKDK